MGVSSACVAAAVAFSVADCVETGVKVINASEIGNEADDETGVMGVADVVVVWEAAPVSATDDVGGGAFVSMRLVTEAEAPRVPP